MRADDDIVLSHLDDLEPRIGITRVERARRQAREFFARTKPRVVSLIIFTAVIGMLLATPGMVRLQPLLFGAVGVALVAGAAAAMNYLLERNLDARKVLSRTSAPDSPWQGRSAARRGRRGPPSSGTC